MCMGMLHEHRIYLQLHNIIIQAPVILKLKLKGLSHTIVCNQNIYLGSFRVCVDSYVSFVFVRAQSSQVTHYLHHTRTPANCSTN